MLISMSVVFMMLAADPALAQETNGLPTDPLSWAHLAITGLDCSWQSGGRTRPSGGHRLTLPMLPPSQNT